MEQYVEVPVKIYMINCENRLLKMVSTTRQTNILIYEHVITFALPALKAKVITRKLFNNVVEE